jgi:tRNA(Ser,Leu) C12 N-acetylase TAN1
MNPDRSPDRLLRSGFRYGRRGKMIHDWNVIISVREGAFTRARKLLGEYGPVGVTGFLNILVMRVDEPKQFLEVLAKEPDLIALLGRVLPVHSTFSFQSPEEFEVKAREAVLAFASELHGKTFHVRMHRHGFKGRLSSKAEETLLGGTLLEALEKAGAPGRVTFEDPDAILTVETLGNQVGLSLWTRQDLKRYPFLRLD